MWGLLNRTPLRRSGPSEAGLPSRMLRRSSPEQGPLNRQGATVNANTLLLTDPTDQLPREL